ncbi:MAG: lysophospholipid acyltransferase family protein [Planctomycetes bacterium]|nr:lysophospholipid acyltransferase family protein [Planctomycetota bacterium]
MAEAFARLPAVEYAKPRIEHYFEYLVLRVTAFFVRWLPRALALFCLRRIADLARVMLKRRNRQTLDTIRARLSPPPPDPLVGRILKGSYYLLAENFAYQVRKRDFHKYILPRARIKGLEHLEEARLQGKGIVVATMHTGCWECGGDLAEHLGFYSAVIVAVQHNPLCDRFFNDRRSASLLRPLHNRLAVRHGLKFLKQGGLIYVLADVDIGERGIFVPFLGKAASTPAGPAELALRSGAVLIVGAIFRDDDDCFNFSFSAPLSPGGEGLDHNQRVLYLSTQMDERYSEVIRKHPEQWFWLQRRWKTPAPENPSPVL